MIITRRHRRAGLPKRKVFVIVPRVQLDRHTREQMMQALATVRDATFVLLPMGCEIHS